MQVYHLDLQELPLFREVSALEVDRFIMATGATIKRVSKGERILGAYEENGNIGVMVEGEAQVLAEDRFGNESVSHNLERGAMLGSTSAIMPQIPYDMSIEALTDVLVLWIPYKALLTAGPKLGRTHGLVMKNLLEAFCRKNVLMMQKIKILSQKTLRERLILYLIYKEQRQGRKKVHVPGRVQLAKELECNRSALTREISAMYNEGVLYVGEDWMELDADKVAEMG
ncbi:MAG: Crp/Fnr family transcriptional regulator [Selenomonas sp.]|uniref:Crp/Fnr family transcriptional regulator n=1 Tax=Selenomonas sp. TaxID=2053611 RepID=UPI0025F11552|nr:Crp/Fnr family transcriptional regulator [Selenomonas sp.]MCR5756314.1 Crp/Fnr family transcriptional regulator [Selenomonas sp.]